jgi:eukaryotic-like serine/threonine-protein kinase
MKLFLRFALVGLLLVVVALTSAVITMSLAIHGAEATVPNLVGMSPAEGERAVAKLGLNLIVERQYYSADVSEGRITTQVPSSGTRVRRGWQVRVAQSLGPQRVAIPDVLGQSGRAADLNIRRRGLDVSSVAYLQLEGDRPDQVVAQSPPANTNGVSAPRINLLIGASAQPQGFVMPSFIGQPLGTVNLTLLDAGFHVGAVTASPGLPEITNSPTPQQAPPPQPSPASIVVSQLPTPGQRINAGSSINFEVR